MGKLLIIRFSALGDVAMTVPVVYSLANQYPDLEITILTRNNFEAIFKRLPENIIFKGVDLKQYDGIAGLSRLYGELKAESYDYVADFHGVLRTNYLRFRFRISGVSTAVVDKGRKEKKKLTRKKNKILHQLDTSFIRYKKVLEKLGFYFDLNFKSIYGSETADISEIHNITGQKGKDKWIGIAPFSKHKGKTYPLELQEKVIAHFVKAENTKVFLFGGGKYEMDVVYEWNKIYPGIISVIGRLNMEQEIALLSNLDVIISMDSANMHLASLVNTPVISIWGATHPFAGFMGWNQSEKNAIQTDLYCRPCSVFGQKPCYRGDYACLYGIEPGNIIDKTEDLLNKQSIN